MARDGDELLLQLIRLLCCLFLRHDAPDAPLGEDDLRHAVPRDDGAVREDGVGDDADEDGDDEHGEGEEGGVAGVGGREGAGVEGCGPHA